jgi:GTP-binding protein
VPSNAENIATEYQILLNELKLYNPSLLDKERILCISKMDLVQSDEDNKRIQSEIPEGLPHIFISSILQQGLVELKDLLWKTLQDAQPIVVPEATDDEL